MSSTLYASSRWKAAGAALCLVAAILALLLLSGCQAASSGASMTDPRSSPPSPTVEALIAEALVEGTSSDADGSAVIGGERLYFVGKVSQDLRRIHTAAVMLGDDELAAVAALAMVCLAPAHEQDEGWRLVASCIEQSDTGLAVAMARGRVEFIGWLENMHRSGLQPSTRAWRDACLARSSRMFDRASSHYQAAQGWVDDDEDQIALALTEFRESHDLATPSGLSVDGSLQIRRGVSMCEGDLWAGQAKSANQAYEVQVTHGEQRYRSIMGRLGSLLEYTQHITGPSFGQTEQLSFGGAR
jgi:hypothetical protein